MFREDLVSITKDFLDGKIEKEAACELIENALASSLGRAGVTGLGNLTDAGMIAALFFLYGAGLLPPATLNDFAANEERKDVMFYALSLKPSQQEGSMFYVDIRFAKKAEETSYNVDSTGGYNDK